MAVAVSNAAKSLEMPEEIISDFLTLVKAVQGATEFHKFPAGPTVKPEFLLNDLIQEYDMRL